MKREEEKNEQASDRAREGERENQKVFESFERHCVPAAAAAA